MSKLSVATVIERIAKIHGDMVILDIPTYVDTQHEATFFVKDYGPWLVRPNVVLRGGLPLIFRNGKLKISIEEFKDRLKTAHNSNVSLIEGTYVELRKKARFTDVNFGEWEAEANSVLKGHGHPVKGMLKQALSSNKYASKIHWKTNEQLICQGSWESKVVDYLNINRIDFKWQSETFTMPNGKTYRPDLFLINANTWIEIKGFFHGNSKLKWDWFHSIIPNSELWNKEKLKKMGIL